MDNSVPPDNTVRLLEARKIMFGNLVSPSGLLSHFHHSTCLDTQSVTLKETITESQSLVRTSNLVRAFRFTRHAWKPEARKPLNIFVWQVDRCV